MTQDEILVDMLKNSTAVLARCGGRVYHLEVFQNTPSTAQYPCVVYRLTDVMPEKELDGNNGYSTSQYDVYVITVTSDDLRVVCDEIIDFGRFEYNQAVWANPDYGIIESVDTDSETEENDFAIEQQELGYKVSTVNISLVYSRC